MKTQSLVTALSCSLLASFTLSADTTSVSTDDAKKSGDKHKQQQVVQKDASISGKEFDTRAKKSLIAMSNKAKELKIEGVAVVCFVPKGQTEWQSSMRVVGKLNSQQANFLSIAYTKASEMARTLKTSGKSGGPKAKLVGETGWEGGDIKEFNGGYIITAFSGGPSAKDLLVSKAGISAFEEN